MRFVLLVILLFSPNLLFAAGGGHGHVPQLSDLTWYFVHFPIYFGLIGYLIWKKGPPFLSERRTRIEQSVKRGEREIAAAKEVLREAEKLAAGVDREIERIVKGISKEAENETSAVVKEAKQRAEKIKQQAEQLAATEEQAANRAIREELAEIVVRRAEEKFLKGANLERDRARREAAISGVRGLV